MSASLGPSLSLQERFCLLADECDADGGALVVEVVEGRWSLYEPKRCNVDGDFVRSGVVSVHPS